MSAPTYRDYTRIAAPERLGLFRWQCRVFDGYTGPELLVEKARTRGGAHRAAVFAAANLRRYVAPVLHPYGPPSITDAQVAAVCDRLWETEHIWVEALVDEQRRVCVLPCCEVTTLGRVHIIAAFEALSPEVRVAVMA